MVLEIVTAEHPSDCCRRALREMHYLSYGQPSIWHSTPCILLHLRDRRPDKGTVIGGYRCDWAIEHLRHRQLHPHPTQ